MVLRASLWRPLRCALGNILPITVVVTMVLGPDTPLYEWTISLYWSLLGVLVLFAFLPYPPGFFAWLTLGLLAGLPPAYLWWRRRSPGGRGFGAFLEGMASHLSRTAGALVRHVLFPAWMFVFLGLDSFLFARTFVALVCLSVLARIVFRGQAARDAIRGPLGWQQAVAALAVIVALGRSHAMGREIPADLVRLSDIPAYGMQVCADENLLYFSHSRGSEYYGSDDERVAEEKSFYAKINLGDGEITRSPAVFGVSERFVLLPERNLLVGFDSINPDKGLILAAMDTLEVLETHPLPVEGIQDVALGPKREAVYLVAEFENDLYRFDLREKTWTRYDLASPWGFCNEIKLSAEANAFYVSQWGTWGVFVNRIRADDPSRGTYSFLGFWTSGLALDPGHNRLFAARPLHGRIDVLAMDTLEKISSMPAPIFLRRIAYDPSRDRVYGLQFLPGGLSVHDATAGTLLRFHRAPPYGRALRYSRELDRLFIGASPGVFEVPRAWLE